MQNTVTESSSGSDTLNSETNIGIWLDQVCLDFPVFGTSARSIRQAVLSQSIGGKMTMGDKKSISTIRALKSINLTLGPGDRVGLIGHNGAGKSTLLQVLAGIYHPTGGTIRHQGTAISLTDLHIGYDDDATGYEMILLRGLLTGLSKEEISEKADEIVEFSELGAFIDLPMRTYSSGMSMRLFFSIATAFEGDIVLMDEWLFAGDESFMSKANDRLNRLVDDASIMVVASHSRDIVQSMCNRGIVLHHGEIIADTEISQAYIAYDKVMTKGP